VRYLTKVLRDTFPFSEVAIKVLLRAKGEGGSRRDDEAEEELPLAADIDEDMPPIVRKPGKVSPANEPEEPDSRPAEPPPTPKLRPKKKPGAETWDF
jgi:GTP-binding protein